MDGSEYAKKAAAAARDLANLSQGEVVVFHLRARDPSRFAPATIESSPTAVELVDDVVTELKEGGVNARGETQDEVHGREAQAIIAEAERSGADVIVMGSRGLSDFSELLLGSVAHKVIQHSSLPVLVVR